MVEMEELVRFVDSLFGPFGYLLLIPFIYAVVTLVFLLIRPILNRVLFESEEVARRAHIRKRLSVPVSLAFWSTTVLSTESQLFLFFSEDQWRNYGQDIFATLFIISLSFIAYRVLKILFIVVRSKIDVSSADNLRQRRALTQLQFIEKVVYLALWVVTLGVTLLRFESLAEFGGGVLASAGVASVVIGFAAQESVSNLIAGLQIAFTQPLRIDDAVVVEGEWGWIEEITLTYVVVRIWDKRRLVVPIKYFTTHHFENWTREEAQILGTVVLYLDYRAPIKKIRKEFERLVSASEFWDGEVNVMQAIDSSEKTVTVRGLMSGKDSPTVWGLRCEVREKLLDFIQRECPEALPQTRVLMSETSREDQIAGQSQLSTLST